MGKQAGAKNKAALNTPKKTFSSSKKAGKAKQGCPLANKKKCDFADITFQRVPADLGKTYEKGPSGSWQEKQPTEKTFELKFSEIVAKKAKPLLQIIAGPEAPGVIGSVTGMKSNRARKKVKVTSSMAEGPCESATHPQIAVSGGQNLLEYKGPGKCASISFDVFRNEGLTFSEKVGFSLASVWPCRISPRVYPIVAETCGNRSSGKRVRGGTVNVEVFPCEQYAFSLKLPAFKKGGYKVESTRKYDSEKKRYVTETSTESSSQSGYGSNKQGTTTKSTETLDKEGRALENARSKTTGEKTITSKTTYQADGGIENERTAKIGDTDSELTEGKYGSKQWIVKGKSAPSDQIVFELSRAGSTESLGGDIVKLLNWLRYTHSELESLKDTIKNFMPQVGASFDFSFSFLEGSFGAAWGYKEHTDHRVFFAWEAEIAMKLMSATVSASFGFQMSSLLTAKLQLDITGEVTANIKRARSKPEQAMSGDGGTAGVKGSIDGKISGVAQAGIGWCRVSREIGAKSGYEVGAELIVTEGELAFKGSAKFKGVSAYITSKDIDEPETTDLYEIIGESEEHTYDLPTPPPTP